MGAGRAFYIIRLHQICTPYSAKCNVRLVWQQHRSIVFCVVYFNLWSIDILSISAQQVSQPDIAPLEPEGAKLPQSGSFAPSNSKGTICRLAVFCDSESYCGYFKMNATLE